MHLKMLGKRRAKFRACCAAAMAIPAMMRNAHAQTTGLWTGASGTDTNWSNSGNWQSSTVPQAAGDVAYFNTGTGAPVNINLSQNESIGTLNFYGSSAATWNIGSSNGSTLNISGINATSGTAININNSTPIITVSITANLVGNLGGTLVLEGAESHSTPQTLNFGGTNNFSGGEIDMETGILMLSSTSALNGIGSLFMNENTAVAGNGLSFNASNINLTCPINAARSTTFLLNGNQAVISGPISGGSASGSAFNVSGGVSLGALYLTNSNTNANKYSVYTDTRLIGEANNAFGTSASSLITVNSGGTVGFQTSGGMNYTTAEPISLNNNGANDGAGAIGALESISGYTSYPGPISFTTNSGSKTNGIGVKAGTLTLTGNITTTAGPGYLEKIGPGTLALSGNNTFAGTTNLDANGGTLLLQSTTALADTAQVNISSGSRLNFYTGTGASINLDGGAAKLNVLSGGAIGGELGGSVNFAAATVAGNVSVDIFGSPATSNPSGSYTLVTATGGLSAGTYSVGNIYNDTNFTVTGVTSTATTISATVSAATPLTTAYWTGSGTIWSLSNGSSGTSNWAVNSSGGGVSTLIPAPTTNVFFSANGAANQSNVVLGLSQTINSLTINDPVPVTLNNDLNTLTIQGAGGIAVTSGAGLATLSDSIALTGPSTQISVNSSNGAVFNGLVTATNALTAGGSGNTTFNGAVNASNGLTTVGAGTITFNGNLNVTGGVTTNGSGTAVFNGMIGGSTGFTAAGSGNAIQNVVNTYTGTTSVTGTSLTLNQPSGSTVTLLAPATAGQFTGNLVVANPIRLNFDSGSFSGGGQIQIQSTGSALTNSNTAFGAGSVTNPIVLNSSSLAFTKGNVKTAPYTPGTFVTTLGGTSSPNATSPLVISGVISGNSDLNIANNATTGGGSGAMSLGSASTPGGSSGYETYTGSTLINSNNATITFLNSNVLPTSTDVIQGTISTVGSGNGLGLSILDLNGFNQSFGSISDGTYASTTHYLTITNSGSTAAILTVGGLVTPATSFSGPLKDGTSTIGLVKTGIDTISLAGGTGSSTNGNNYSGGVTVNQGTLNASGGSSTVPTLGKTFVTVNPTGTSGTTADAATLNTTGPAIANGTVLTVNTNSPTAIGTVDFTSGGPTVGSLSGNGNVVLSNLALTIGYTNNLSSTFSGVISDAGAGSLIKAHNGTLTLSNASTYAGGTNVSAGKLVVTNMIGSATGSGPVLVVNGATLGGAGSISGLVTENGTVAPGVANTSSPSTLTIGSGSVLAGTTVMDLTSTDVSDEILFGTNGSGIANFSQGSLTVNNTGVTTLAAGQTYTLFDFSSAIGSFNSSAITLPVLGSGLGWNTSNLTTTGTISINTVVVGPANLTWNNTGGNPADGVSWDVSNNQNFNNGTGASIFRDGDNVTFNDTTVNNQYAVNIVGAVSPGSTTFNNSVGNYTVTGTNGSSGISGVGGVIKLGSGTVTISSSNSYTGGTTVQAGSLVLASANAFPVNTGLTVAPLASLSLANHGSGSTYVPQVSMLSNGGTIDIGNNAMVIHNISNGAVSAISSITAQVLAAYNGGAWNGTNTSSGIITSSMAQADTTHLTAVGVATGLTSFEGQSVLATDVLVKYTWYGDATLDGHVDGSDYSRIDSAYLTDETNPTALTGWFNGDFNYDGVIDGSDYTLIDNAYNSQGTVLAASIASLSVVATAQVAGGSSAVPEPTALGILGIGVAGLLGRRHRK